MIENVSYELSLTFCDGKFQFLEKVLRGFGLRIVDPETGELEPMGDPYDPKWAVEYMRRRIQLVLEKCNNNECLPTDRYIAAALAQEAPILLLDEPTVFLDPKHKQELYQLLEDLNKEEKISIIAVTHDINLAVLYSSRILALKNGRLLTDSSPEEIANAEMLHLIFDADFIMTAHPETGDVMALPVK